MAGSTCYHLNRFFVSARLPPLLTSRRVCSALQSPSRQRCTISRGLPRDAGLSLPFDQDLDTPLPGFDSIASALTDLAAGKFLVVLDDENRENEGDLIIAADRVSTEAMAFMVEHTSGVICIGMEGKDLDRLRLPLMINSAENEVGHDRLHVASGLSCEAKFDAWLFLGISFLMAPSRSTRSRQEALYTAFTVTVDLRDGITTGISAADRSATLLKLADPSTRPEQLRRPGHIFPLRARPGGVLVRPGHTEASVDLARLAGCFPAGALCEIVSKADGSMARTPELLGFARKHGLKCITIADLMRYRLKQERLFELTDSATIETPRFGRLQVHTFLSTIDGAEHVALVSGNVSNSSEVLVQVKREGGLLADLLTSVSGGGSTEDALHRFAKHGPGGVLVLMRQAPEGGRGRGLADELKRLTSPGADSHPSMDLRDYGLAAQILLALKVQSVVASSEDEAQAVALKSCGVRVVDVDGAPLRHATSPAIANKLPAASSN